MPTVSLAIFKIVLAEFAQAVGAGQDKQIILVIDGAGFHQEKNLTVPKGIELVYLPAYSPELQPAERLWPLTDEAVANRCFTDLDQLEEKLISRCQKLEVMKEEIKNQCLFHWWPKLVH